jgi:hypothetical protein
VPPPRSTRFWPDDLVWIDLVWIDLVWIDDLVFALTGLA